MKKVKLLFIIMTSFWMMAPVFASSQTDSKQQNTSNATSTKTNQTCSDGEPPCG